MARKTKEEAEATKDAILDAAAKVFLSKGVAKASLEEIAVEAGVTRGAIYWHFKNKADIFAALHEQLFVPFSEMLLEGLERKHSDPLEQLRTLCVDLLIDLEHKPQKRRVLTIFFLKCDYSGDMERFLQLQREQKIKSMEIFSLYFERALEKGYLPNHRDPKVLTYALISYITGVVFEYLRNPGIITLEKQAESLINIFFNGLVSGK